MIDIWREEGINFRTEESRKLFYMLERLIENGKFAPDLSNLLWWLSGRESVREEDGDTGNPGARHLSGLKQAAEILAAFEKYEDRGLFLRAFITLGKDMEDFLAQIKKAPIEGPSSD